MSESQFEKLLKTLERVKEENKQLREENARLRDAVKKEVNDEPE